MDREYGIKQKINFLKEEIDWETRITKVGDALGRERAWERIDEMTKELNRLETQAFSKKISIAPFLMWMMWFGIVGFAIFSFIKS